MKWKQFKDEMPQGACRLLICGIVRTDPLEQCTNYEFMEFVNYGAYGFLYPDDNARFIPNPEYYWIYQKDIETPFEQYKEK